MTTPAPKAPKTKKIDLAVEIFKRHLPTRDTLSKRDFRAAVVADMKKELDVSNAGTLGMYFAWSDQLVSGRQSKQYNRTAPRRTKAAVAAAAAAPSGEDINKLVNEFDKAVAKTAAKKKPAAKKAVSKKAVSKKGAPKKANTNLTPSI